MELSTNEFLTNKFNTKTLKAVILFLLFILLYGVNNTYIYFTSILPFGISLVFALLFIGFNGYILGGLYLLVSVMSSITMPSILQGVNTFAVLFLIQFLLDRNKINITKLIVFVFALVSQIAFIACSIGDIKSTLAVLIAVVLGMFFLYSCICFLDATIGKGLLGDINLDEKICGCVILIIFCIGICNARLSIISLNYVFSTIIILVSTRIYGNSVSLMCGVLIGLGFSIFYVDPIYVSLFVVLTLACIAFKCNYRIISLIAYILAYILFCFFFELGIAIGEIIAVIIGGIIYMLIPKKILDSVLKIFTKSRSVALENVFNNSKKELVTRVKDLSFVFAEMDKVYRDMVRGNLSDDKAKVMLKEETISQVCGGCENKDRCFRSNNSFMDNCYDAIISTGYDKSKLLLIDVPEYMTTNCARVNQIIQVYNNILSVYFDYKNAITNIDTSRVLIADQLTGVSRLLSALAKEVDVNVSFDNKYEGIIKEHLGYCGIVCLECVVYEKDIQNTTITLIVKKSQYKAQKIEKIVSKTMNTKFRISSISDGDMVGTINVTLANAPNYDIAFGSAVSTKSGKLISGDNHSVISIGEGKYIVSICDGMGSGKKANDISRLTLSLIENFYRAGFDNEIILSSVNKLLSLNEQENFSTIDLCVIDGKKNIYDFVKLGASNGYIRRNSGEVVIVSSSGLPIGVLENIRPHITKLCISPMDIVVLVSDGVSDILGDELKNILRTTNTINPQLLSEEILSLALEKNNGIPSDDMTVICVRVFESV